MKEKVSVIINTLNEELNIRNCLETLKWVDEIIVVDMFSEDKTVDIAKNYTDNIYSFQRTGYVEPARQFALEKATNEWILLIDADELVTVELAELLLEVVRKKEFDAVIIPRTNYFFGKKMKGTGWGSLQDSQLRFFKKSVIGFNNRIHSRFNLVESAKVYKIKNEQISLIHFNYINVEHFIEKLNRYTTIEALNDFNEGKKYNLIKAILVIIKEFIYRFFIFKGYKDKFQGFTLSLLMVMYKLSASLKLKLMEEYNNIDVKNEVYKEYNKIAKKERDKWRDFGIK